MFLIQVTTKNIKIVNKPEIKQEGLNAKTEGVLGFIKENENKEDKSKKTDC